MKVRTVIVNGIAWILVVSLTLVAAVTLVSSDIVTGSGQALVMFIPLAALAVAVAAGGFIFRYLQDSNEAPLAIPAGVDIVQRLAAMEKRLKGHIGRIAADELMAEVRNAIEQDQANWGSKKELEKWHDRTTKRFLSELPKLYRRGGLNLFLGIVVTFVGVLPLVYFVFFQDQSDVSLGNTLLRISLTLFIEVFAYFFLRLYRDSLAEIKYFQNETTNIESKFLALRVALGSSDGQFMVRDVVNSLARTDRNVVLRRESASAEDERVLFRDVLHQIEQVLARTKPGGASRDDE